MTTEETIRAELATFTGGLSFIQWNTPHVRAVLSEGVAYLVQAANAGWLMDAIFSKHAHLSNEPFQVWELTRADDHWALCCGDGNEEPGEPRELVPTMTLISNFPLPEGIKLYTISGDGVVTVLLPREY